MKRLAPVALALSFALVLGATRDAQADPAADQLFLEARRLMSEGHYVDACPKLEESFRLVAGIGTSFHLADCYEHTNKPSTAWSWFRKTAAAAHVAGQPDREAAAQERADALAPKLCRLRVEVPKPLDRIEVARDGEVLGDPQWGLDVPVDPGPHVVTATIPGHAPWEKRLAVDACPRTESVVVPSDASAFALLPPPVLPPIQGPPLVPTRETPPPPPPLQPPNTARTAAFVAFGVTGVAAIVGGAFGVLALVRKSDSNATCTADDTCQPAGLEARLDAVHAGNVSTVGFATALGAAAVGTVLYVVSSRPSRVAFEPRGAVISF